MSNPTEYNRAEYIGRLVRVDIPGALDYLDACGETERADALRQRPMNPPAYDTKYAFLNPFLNAYQNYFQTCFGAGLAGAADLKAVETVACTALEQNLRELLAMPDADLEQLEDAFCHKAQAVPGWNALRARPKATVAPISGSRRPGPITRSNCRWASKR